MKIPSYQEALGVQSREDAELFKKEFPEWVELSRNDPRKKEIIDRMESEVNILTVIAVLLLILLVFFVYKIFIA